MSAEVWAALESLLDQGPEGAAQADELARSACGESLRAVFLDREGAPIMFWRIERTGWRWRLRMLERALKSEGWPLFLGRAFTDEEIRAVDSLRRRSAKIARLITRAEAAILAPITPRIADAARLATKGYRPQPGDVLRAYLPSNHPLRSLS